MITKFVLEDKHVAFCNGIASGEQKWKAYLKHISPRKNAKKMTCASNATKLLARPEVQDCLNRIKKEREAAITKANLSIIPKEFTTAALTVDQMDSFHYSVAIGMVKIEEHIVVYRIEEVLNEAGKVVKRTRTPNIQKYWRDPNVREKQISIAELYKRFGSYAPSKIAGWFRNNGAGEEEGEQVDRVVVLSNGEKVAI